MKKNRYFTTFFAGIILAFSGCTIGLGESVDLTGPELVLLSPSVPRQCLNDSFVIKGTVADDTSVKSVTVTLGDYKWHHEDGNWMYKDKDSENFVAYPDSVWEVKGNLISWEIRNVNIATTGMFELVASSVDGSGNTSASSEKKILINIDKIPPSVNISTPNIHYENWEELDSAFGPYGRNSTDYQQLFIVNNVETGGFKLSGIASDNNTVKSVTVYLNRVDTSTGQVEQEALITKKFVLQGEAAVEGAIVHDSLRTWSVNISSEELNDLGTGKSYLQVSSESSDTADNTSGGLYVHGYIVYWPAASRPWVSINLSTEDNGADRTKLYAGNAIYGNAFDNSQVTKIVQDTWVKSGDTYISVAEYSNKILYSYNANATDAEICQTKDFSITLPSEVNDYKIQIKATDDSGLESDVFTGYAYIADATYPSLSVAPIANAFGDSDGNLRLVITASDDTSVKSVKVKYANTADDKKNYADKNSASWSSPSKTFVLSDFTYSDSHADESGMVKKFWKLEHIVNLFTDMNIGMNANKLSEQTFIFLIEDDTGNKTVSKFVSPADTESPVLTFKTINGNQLSEDNVLPVFKDDFILGGTWSDDSYRVWGEKPEGKPTLVASVRGKSVSSDKINLNSNGTWIVSVPLDYIKESGSVVGAMDVSLSIKDIGGNEISIQKGFEIDTNELALDYVSVDVPSGTYPAGKEINIVFNFNKNAEFKGSGIPVIRFNNNKTAALVNKGPAKKFNFKYKIESGDDVKKLSIASIDFAGCSLKDVSDNEYTQVKLNEALSTNTINKDICILTVVPAYKSHEYIETSNQLQIVFTGLVTPNVGTIVITQDESNLVAPAVLTKDEYNNTSAAVQAFYEENTNGASSEFVPDLTTKYVLNYDKNTNDEAVVAAYKATGAHKLSFNILGEAISYTQHDDSDDLKDTTTFTIDVGPLPVKGASYTFSIAENLVKNAANTSNAASTAKTISSTGVEKPVIRIYKPTQTITGCSDSSSGTVTHALSTTFKIDCETPGVTLKYSYDCLVPPVCEVSNDGQIWGGTANNIDNRQEEWHVKFTYNGTTYTTKRNETNSGGKPNIVPVKNDNYSIAETSYSANSKIDLGKYNNADISYDNGLTYRIIATANDAETAYDVAYRTTLVFKEFNSYAVSVRTNAYSYWPYSSSDTSNNCTIFLRGGENKEGANATSGLPASWNINEKDKVVMMNAYGNDYYFTTWTVTVDKFYFQPMAGLCDANTSNNQGPSYSIYLQDGIIFRLPEYPIGKGEYMTVTYNSRFDLGVPGKVMKHR